MTTEIYFGEPPLDKAHSFYVATMDGLTETINAASKVNFVKRVSLNEVRMNKLVHYRNFFGYLTLFLLLTSVAFSFFSLPYEPAFALVMAALGMFVVFTMKVADAR